MSDRVQAEIVHGDAATVEVIRESDSTEKMDVGTALDQVVAQRRAEHPEWYADEIPDTSEQEQVETEELEAGDSEQAGSEDTPEPEPEPHAEPESKALKRILDREAKLRQDKADFETKQKEYEKQLEEFQRAKEYATSDPVTFLKTLGISQEELIEVAKAAYYESLGDMAPDDYKGQKELQALRREIAELKSSKKAPEDTPDTGMQDALVAYQESMLEATKTFDSDNFPYVAHVVDAYSEADVAADMFSVAQDYARKMGGEGEPLTPEQCLAEVNSRYEKLLGKLVPQQVEAAESTPKPGSKRKKATLSNSLSSNVPPEKPLEGLSYDEIVARARANFHKAANGGD